MNPEERALLERIMNLSEKNNILLAKMEKRGKWLAIWGFVKIAIFILPFILGYLLLQPYIGPAVDNFKVIQGFYLNTQ